MKDKKKVISLILSMLMLSSFGSSVYANNSDTILDEAENIAGEISVDTEITDVIFNDIVVKNSDEYVVMSAGEKDEVESNDTYDLADRTYDDYDNYGTIDTRNDVDWWEVTFDEDGEANFWLGNIPEGCDYDLYVYDEYGVANDDHIGMSQNPDNEQERITIEVEADVTYYVKILSYSGSSDDYYLFRIKNYPYATEYDY